MVGSPTNFVTSESQSHNPKSKSNTLRHRIPANENSALIFMGFIVLGLYTDIALIAMIKLRQHKRVFFNLYRLYSKQADDSDLIANDLQSNRS
jgi:hypothetical protein